MIKRQSGFMVAAVSVVALALAGCGGGGSSGGGGKTKVVVWDGYEDAQGKNITALIEQYNQEHPTSRSPSWCRAAIGCSRRC